MNPIPQQAIAFFKGVSPWDELPEEQLLEFIATTNLVYLTHDNEELIEQQIEQGNSVLLVQNGDFEVCERVTEKTSNLRFISDSEYVFPHSESVALSTGKNLKNSCARIGVLSESESHRCAASIK